MKRPDKKRVVVPVVLAVTVIGTIAAAVSGTASCSSSSSPKPHVDAGIGDGPADVPII